MKNRILIASFSILSIAVLLTSCKSLADSLSKNALYGGKEPIENNSQKKIRSSSSLETGRLKSSSNQEEGNEKAVGARSREKMVDSLAPIDDEALLMREIPQTNQSGKDKVPGVESLIVDDGPIELNEDSANRIIDAKGNDVIINGDDGVIVIKGGCGKLVLKGQNNQVQCDLVETIEISGDGNTLILGSMGGGTIKGNRNDLSWGSGIDGLSPIVESFGSNNSMKRLE